MYREVLDLDRYLPFLLTATANKLSKGASRVYRDKFDLGITDWRVLAMLAVEPDITAARICAVIGLDKAATSRSLIIMKERGLVCSPQERHKDKRAVLLRLTEKGYEVHDAVMRLALIREQKLLEVFDEDERERLISLLSRLHAQVDEVNAMSYADENLGILEETLSGSKKHTLRQPESE